MIENIVLSRDHRGISALRPYLPSDFCERAAALILGRPGTAFIVTGFFIPGAGATETDGPPGAVALGSALRAFGFRPVYVSDSHTTPLLRELVGDAETVVEFPMAGHEESRAAAARLVEEWRPSVMVAIERCGLTDEQVYRNMRGLDVSAYHAKLDYLFEGHPCSVGIGDGGNEIGMGNLSAVIPLVTPIVGRPCATKTTGLVISSVSNWGAWGLVAAISRLRGQNLLPTRKEVRALLARTVELGAVDGVSGRHGLTVDGFPLEENERVLGEMHAWLARHGVAARDAAATPSVQ
jgi:hypothetical protein